MAYKERQVLPEKHKMVKITFKERIKEVLGDILGGMDFLKPHQSWAQSFFDALSERIQEEDGVLLDMEPDFYNMLRELDAILLESGVAAVLIRNIQQDLDAETRKKYRDRKRKARKPLEDLERFLVSN